MPLLICINTGDDKESSRIDFTPQHALGEPGVKWDMGEVGRPMVGQSASDLLQHQFVDLLRKLVTLYLRQGRFVCFRAT